MSEQILIASTPKDYLEYASVIEEYVRWCKQRYADDVWFINEVFGHQSLATELSELPIKYGPPNGKTLIVRCDGEVAGAGAIHRLDAGVCEMKRVFVLDQFKGRGIGKRLCKALIDAGRDDDYKVMRLDTANRLEEAIGLYRSLGFKSCDPYLSYPATLTPYILFMELPLVASKVQSNPK